MLANRLERVQYIVFGDFVVRIQDDVIHGKNALKQAIIIDDRQTAYLPFSHGVKRR